MSKLGMTKKEISWVLYDVGNSAFVMLSSALIPVYFASIAEEGSSIVVAWGYAETVASLILALVMPILGIPRATKRSFLWVLLAREQ